MSLVKILTLETLLNNQYLSSMGEMDLQGLKLELVRQILDLDSKETVSKVYALLDKEKKDFWVELTEAQKKEVEIGLKQIEIGQTEDWNDFLERVS